MSQDIEASILSPTRSQIVLHRAYSPLFFGFLFPILSGFRSLVGFGPKQRAIGEAAKTQETSNFKNTIGSLKRLIGRTLNDPQVQNVEKKFINAALVDVAGTLGVDVRSTPEFPSVNTLTRRIR